MKRLSLASMLTALAVLAAPAVSTYAQSPDRAPSANPGALRSAATGKAAAPRDAAHQTTPDATLESKSQSELAGPSPERAATLKKAAQVKKTKEANKVAKQAAQRAKKKEDARRLQEAQERQAMQAMILRANYELEVARLQAARMEGMERRQAEERMVQLQTDLANARATESQRQSEYIVARDDPEQYRRYQQAQLEAARAQQEAFERLGRTLARTLQARDAQQGQPSVISGGTSGSTGSSSSSSSQGGSTGRSFTQGNPGGGVARGQSTPPSGGSNNTADQARKAEREAALRNKPF